MTRTLLLAGMAIAAGCSRRQAGDVEPSVAAQAQARKEVAIELERGACHGTCPMYRVSIDGTGKVGFEGKGFVQQEGVAAAEVSPERVDKLVKEIEESGFFALPDSFTASVPACAPYAADLPTVITDVTIGTEHKRIVHDHGCNGAPDMLARLERRIDEVAETSRWTGH